MNNPWALFDSLIVGVHSTLTVDYYALGANNISGYCVTDRSLFDAVIRSGDSFTIFDAGVMVSVDR